MSFMKNKLKVLGAYGSKFGDMHPATFLINDNISIDGGNILQPLSNDSLLIDYIILTHSHLDHICDIPFLIDIQYPKRKDPLYIFGLEETLNNLKEHLFNCSIWPDFGNIKLINSDSSSVRYINVEPYKEFKIGDISFLPVPSEHTVPTVGYVINYQIYITGDTISKETVLEITDKYGIRTLFIDVSFPSVLDNIAHLSKHHSTNTVRELLQDLKSGVDIFIYHIKPQFYSDVVSELSDANVKFLKEGDLFYFL